MKPAGQTMPARTIARSSTTRRQVSLERQRASGRSVERDGGRARRPPRRRRTRPAPPPEGRRRCDLGAATSVRTPRRRSGTPNTAPNPPASAGAGQHRPMVVIEPEQPCAGVGDRRRHLHRGATRCTDRAWRCADQVPDHRVRRANVDGADCRARHAPRCGQAAPPDRRRSRHARCCRTPLPPARTAVSGDCASGSSHTMHGRARCATRWHLVEHLLARSTYVAAGRHARPMRRRA